MSVYRVTEVIGVSTESWEAAARTAIETAAASVRELRIAEVIRQDVTIENGQVTGYRVRLGLSFKYDSASEFTGRAWPTTRPCRTSDVRRLRQARSADQRSRRRCHATSGANINAAMRRRICMVSTRPTSAPKPIATAATTGIPPGLVAR